jgi:hypothetical protein
MPPLTRAGRARMGSHAPPQPQSLFERSSPPVAASPVPSSPLSSPLSSPPSSPEQPEHMTVRSPSPLPAGLDRLRDSSTPRSRSPSPLSSSGSTQVLSPLPSEAGSPPASNTTDGGQAGSAWEPVWPQPDPIPRPMYQSPDTPPRERNSRQHWRQDPVPLHLRGESDQSRQRRSPSYPPTSPQRASAPTDQPIGTLSVAVQTHRDQAARDIQLRFYNEWVGIPDESTLVIDLKKHGPSEVPNHRASTDDLILWAGANRQPPDAHRGQSTAARPINSQAASMNAHAREREGEGVDVRLGLVRLYRDPPLRVRTAFRRAVWQLVTDWRLILLFLMLAIPYIVKVSLFIPVHSIRIPFQPQHAY